MLLSPCLFTNKGTEVQLKTLSQGPGKCTCKPSWLRLGWSLAKHHGAGSYQDPAGLRQELTCVTHTGLPLSTCTSPSKSSQCSQGAHLKNHYKRAKCMFCWRGALVPTHAILKQAISWHGQLWPNNCLTLQESYCRFHGPIELLWVTVRRLGVEDRRPLALLGSGPSSHPLGASRG